LITRRGERVPNLSETCASALAGHSLIAQTSPSETL
jgi:hypothetical protein